MSNYRRRLLLVNQTDELYLYGNSVQDGIPAPEAPVEIKSVENPTIKVDGEEIITIDKNTPFGKNLLKPLSSVTTEDSVKYDASSGDGSITINATDERESISIMSLYSGDLNDLLKDGETYTFAMDVSEVKPLSLIICATNKDTKKNVYFNANNYKKFIMSITIDKSKYIYRKIYLQIIPNSYKYENIVVKPILVKGSYTKLPFEQYVPPITTMRGIGEYKDKIYTKEGKVWFEQNIFHIKPTSFSRINSNRGVIQNLHHPNDYLKYNEKISNFGNYKSAWEFQDYIIWYLAKTDSKVSQIWMVPSKEYCDLWTTKEEAWKHLTKTLGIYPEFQYVLETPILTEITGTLAEQILAIDKTKNITITSETGVSGSAEVIVEWKYV